MSVDTTPKCQTKEEVWANVTPDRFVNYMTNKTSDSMMDHYFDKLLQIALFDKKTVANEYLCSEADRRVDPLVQVILKFGKTGKAPISMIKKFAKELEQPEAKKRKSSSNTDDNETNEETKVGSKRKRSAEDDESAAEQ